MVGLGLATAACMHACMYAYMQVMVGLGLATAAVGQGFTAVHMGNVLFAEAFG